MKINTERSKQLLLLQKKETFFTKSHQLKQVREFTYLGSIIPAHRKINKEIQHSCNISNQILRQMSSILQNKHLNITPNQHYIKLFSFLHCATNVRELTAKDIRKIVTTEMACLFRIIEKTRRDRIINKNVRRLRHSASSILHHKTTG